MTRHLPLTVTGQGGVDVAAGWFRRLGIPPGDASSSEPVVAERHVHAGGDTPGDEIVEDLRTDAEQLLDRTRTERGEQRLAKDAVMGRQRERGAHIGEPIRQPQASDIGGLAVGQRSFWRFDVRRP